MRSRYRAVAAATTLSPQRAPPRVPAFDAGEWRRLAGFYGFIALLHVAGWGLYLHYAAAYPSMVGLGFVAYLFGLRHAFDADHIAAVDDTVRYMLQQGKRPLGVGFFFSLGHSTVVFALAAAIVVATAAVAQSLPDARRIGGLIGALVSGTFLWVIGLLNLRVLLGLLDVWRGTRSGKHSHAHLETLLAQRGFFNRLLGGRLPRLVRHSWQMYPLGVLFGLGFDTASEIGLLAMTGGAAAGNLPPLAVLALPILFAAGMSAMDTTDGVLMVKAYDWAFVNPLRKVFYNLTITSLSVAIALVIGTIELVQSAATLLDLDGPFFGAVAALDLGAFGYIIVAAFVVAWVASVALWRLGRVEERYGDAVAHTHPHDHEGGVAHSHRHFH